MFINDVSGSVTAADFAFIIDGYANAFRDSALIDLIEGGAIGSIAVSLSFFSTNFAQTVGWTEISDAASAEAFATLVEGIARPSLGSSDYLRNAVNQASLLFADNGFEGTRNVLDVVTEGANQDGCSAFDAVCIPLQDARDAALAGPLDAINALFLDDRDYFGNDPEDLIDAELYGETNLIGGEGSFSMLIEDFSAFSDGIKAKIAREIAPPDDDPTSPIPLPAGLPLLLAGLGGLFGAKRLKKSKA